MSNETPGERGHWKDRLNDLGRLPEDAWTGKDGAWDTLYDRIHGKPLRRKYPWFRMAAASALVIIGIPISIRIVHERQRSAEATSSISKTASSPAPGESARPVVQNPAGPVAPLPRQTIGHRSAPVIQDASAAAMAPRATMETPRATMETPAILQTPATMQTSAITQTSVAMAAPPAPQKLPVVSINELGMEEDEQPGGSRKTDHYFQIKLINERAYTETASEDSRQQPGRLGIHIHR